MPFELNDRQSLEVVIAIWLADSFIIVTRFRITKEIV